MPQLNLFFFEIVIFHLVLWIMLCNYLTVEQESHATVEQANPCGNIHVTVEKVNQCGAWLGQSTLVLYGIK